MGLDGDTTRFFEALGVMGGGERALMRHAAAYLNAAHPNISYMLTSSGILSAVKADLESGDQAVIETLENMLEEFNELGCSIDQSGEPYITK